MQDRVKAMGMAEKHEPRMTSRTKPGGMGIGRGSRPSLDDSHGEDLSTSYFGLVSDAQAKGQTHLRHRQAENVTDR